MASIEVFEAHNDSISCLLNDYSLLSELEISTNAAQNEDDSQHNNDNFNFTNMQSALMSKAPPGSSVEVLSQMNELIEENNRLKEMLNKNNVMLEENLKQAMEKISSLESENSELKKKTIDPVEKNEQVKSCRKCTTLETGLENMLGVDYVEENQHLFMEWSHFRENLHGNLKYICQHLEEISKSKKTCEEKILFDAYILMLKFKLSFLEGNVECQLDSIKTDEETGFEVVNLKKRENPLLVIAELKKELENKSKEIKEYALKVKECESIIKSQCELLTDKVQKEFSQSKEYKESCRSLEQQIKEFKTKLEKDCASSSNNQVMQDLQEEIQNLKEILKLEQQTSKKDKGKLLEIMTKCEKLQVDYDRVTRLLAIQSKDEKEKLALQEMDKKKFMEEADYLTAKLIYIEQQLEEKNTEIRKLQDHMSQDTKKKMHTSKGQGTTMSHQMDQNSEAVGIILCPICSKGFSNERAAENHTNRCLEENKQ